MTMLDAHVKQAVEVLQSAWTHRQTVQHLPAAVRPVNRQDGYHIQRSLLAALDEPAMGWKIAATSLAGQAHIGVSGPLGGRLLQSRRVPLGQPVSLLRNRMRVLEAEFAFCIGQDITRNGSAALSTEVVMAHVSDMHLAIEIPDSRFAHFVQAGEAQLLADFACACEVVLGPALMLDWRSLDLAAHAVSVYCGGTEVARGQGERVLGDPRRALAWLANELLDHGEVLRAGDLVITGTCVTPVPVEPGKNYRTDFGVLGWLDVSFE